MSGGHTGWIVAGGLIAAALGGLVLLARTRWLQSDTLKKCVVLSVGVHLLLAIVAAGIGGMRPASWGTQDEGRMTMMVVLTDEPFDAISSGPTAEPPAADDAPDATPLTEDVADEPLRDAVDEAAPAALAAEAPADLVPLLETETSDVSEAEPQTTTPEAEPVVEDGDPGEQVVADATGKTEGDVEETGPHTVQPPTAYANRFGERRQAAAAARGGSEATERAVREGLAWLAAAQSPNGHWDADRYGAGVERSIDGRDRQGAGSRSDHGVTGLALLAFLGAGNTPQAGLYADEVKRGIDFLVDRQAENGSLAGDAEFFAALYCHGMATIAVAETLALTGDPMLRAPLARAVAYTLSMQSPATGGWRYAAGDAGDTSQLGWQVMALHSSRLAGVAPPGHVAARAWAFLDRVSSGAAGGLAAYRPGERPSVAMTSEACLCRMLLGMDAAHPAAREAMAMLAQSPPDASHPDAYTWYYATLASFHVGGEQWDLWNRQMQGAVLSLQRQEAGPLQGSWDPDPVWGGHGGRVYSTAMSVMTLEVYYRYLPMHTRAAGPVAAADMPAEGSSLR
jgi:hypothetical protein